MKEGSIAIWQTTLSATSQTVVGGEHSRLTSTQSSKCRISRGIKPGQRPGWKPHKVEEKREKIYQNRYEALVSRVMRSRKGEGSIKLILLQYTGDNAQGRIPRQLIIIQHHYSNFNYFHQILPISAYIHHYSWPIFYYTCCRLDNNWTVVGRASN